MDCPIGAQVDPRGRASTLFPADLGVEQGACVLGMTAGRLIASQERVFQATVSGETAECDRGVDALVARLCQAKPSEVAALIDVNRPLEGIAAAAALRDQALPGARIAAFIPPQDGPVADTGAGGCPPYSRIAACDLVLVVGDACSTHPAIAALLREMQRAAMRNRLICLDTAPGRAGRAADETMLAPPDGLAAALCALAVECGSADVREALGGLGAEEICSQAGLDASTVGEIAAQLREAGAVGIVVAPSTGRWRWPHAVLAAARELAGALEGGALWPLCTCAASSALPALAELLGLEKCSAVLDAIDEGSVKTLVVVGWDPAAVLPKAVWSGWRDRCEAIVWAGSLRSEFAEVADVVLPLALAWEESGLRVGPHGEGQALRQWTAAPAGVPGCERLMARVAATLKAGALTPPALAGVSAPPAEKVEAARWIRREILKLNQPGQDEAVVVGAPEPQGYTGGLSTAGSVWQRRAASEERALLSPALAGAVGCGGGAETILLETRQGAALQVVACAAAGGKPGNASWEGRVIAAPCHWQALRDSLDWKAGRGWAPVADPCPLRVRLPEGAAKEGD